METKDDKIKVGIRIKRSTKERLDKLIEWGLRDHVLDALITRLLDKIEEGEIEL